MPADRRHSRLPGNRCHPDRDLSMSGSDAIFEYSLKLRKLRGILINDLSKVPFKFNMLQKSSYEVWEWIK